MNNYLKMMQRCKSEILGMRNRIGNLEPKAHAYDTISKMVGIMAPQGGGYASEDIVYTLDREIEAETKREAEEQQRKTPT